MCKRKEGCDSFCFLSTANNEEPSQGLTKQITAVKYDSGSSILQQGENNEIECNFFSKMQCFFFQNYYSPHRYERSSWN